MMSEYDFPSPSVLIGGFKGSFSMAQLNAFHEYISDTEEFANFYIAKNVLEAAIRSNSSNIGSATLAQIAADRAIYDLAKTWAEENPADFSDPFGEPVGGFDYVEEDEEELEPVG